MRKSTSFRVVVLLLMIIMLSVSCQNKNVQSNSVCREKYYERIGSNTISQIQGEGFRHSYYYNLESDMEIRLELSLIRKGQETKKIEIKDIKENTGDVDGTFGLAVNRDEDNNTLILTLRLDEDTEQIISPDFFSSIIGNHCTISNGGLIENESTTVFLSEYDVKEDIHNNKNEGSNRQYEWGIKVNIYGTRITENSDRN